MDRAESRGTPGVALVLPVEVAPEEIARAAPFPASDAASCVTGTELVVDGGQSELRTRGGVWPPRAPICMMASAR